MGEPELHRDAAAFLRDGGATGALVAKFNWAATSLGALAGWPQSLKTATAIVLRAPLAMALLWGEEGVMIYNDAYAEIAGERHPELLGSRVGESWPEVIAFNEGVLATVLGGGILTFRDKPLGLRRPGVPETRCFNLDYSPIPGEDGQPAGVLAVVVETTQRMLAEQLEVANAQLQRQMLEQSPASICFLRGPDHLFEFRNEAHKHLLGRRDWTGKSPAEVIARLAPGVPAQLDHVYATGERQVARAQPLTLTLRPDAPPEQHFLDFVLQPVRDERGDVIGILVEGFDVTEQVRAQAAAEESNQRLSAALAIARLGAFTWSMASPDCTLDHRAREIFGFEPNEPVTLEGLRSRIDPQDLARLNDPAAADPAETRREREFRIHLPDGSVRDVLSVSDLLGGPHGSSSRVVSVLNDVTEARAAEKRQRMLINELNHRVKNSLATVQSITLQTLRSARDLASARVAFEGRLTALAAAHDVLTAESWSGARLVDVIAGAMAPFEMAERPQISRSGPPVWLAAQPALALSLALHELATNATKYGALSTPEGRVILRWSLAGGSLTLTWREEGGPPVQAPIAGGFGARLLQRSLARELDGKVVLAFLPEGVSCEICCRANGCQSVAPPAFLDTAAHAREPVMESSRSG